MSKFVKLPFLVVLVLFFSTILFYDRVSLAETDSTDYIIAPNDVLNIFVWKEQELTMDVTVMSDGKISFPLTGDIIASGRTVAQLRADLTEKLKKFIDAPEVTVIVKLSNKLIYVIGNVDKQGPFPLHANMTVLQALAMAGGFSQWADQKNIMIIRREKGKDVETRFNYKDFISGENKEQNIALKSDDTVIVP
jgi:polysaccharide biosynthesis/export protein